MASSAFIIKVIIVCDGCQEKIINNVINSTFLGEIYCRPCDTLNYLEKLPTQLEKDGIYYLEVTKSIQDLLMEGSGL